MADESDVSGIDVVYEHGVVLQGATRLKKMKQKLQTKSGAAIYAAAGTVRCSDFWQCRLLSLSPYTFELNSRTRS